MFRKTFEILSAVLRLGSPRRVALNLALFVTLNINYVSTPFPASAAPNHTGLHIAKVPAGPNATLAQANPHVQQIKLTASDGAANDGFGISAALSADGRTALIGANRWPGDKQYTEQGAAYVFTEDNGNWSQYAELTASDGTLCNYFGSSVALSGDGSIALIGAPGKQVKDKANQGVVYVFTQNNGSWTQQTELTASDG